jgi:hypothetical protein
MGAAKNIDYFVTACLRHVNPMYDGCIMPNSAGPNKPIYKLSPRFRPPNSTDRIQIQYTPYEEMIEIAKTLAYSILKPTLRGGVVGASVGSVVASATGNDLVTSMGMGATVGMIVDGVQYIARMINATCPKRGNHLTPQ